MNAFNNGDKVVLVATSFSDKQKYVGIPAVVDFQAPETCGVAGVVYIRIKAAGQRKARTIAVGAHSLKAI